MEQSPKISVIVTHFEAKSGVISSVNNLKRALAYVSYLLDESLQFEIIYMVSHIAAIPQEEVEQLKTICPISVHVEPDRSSAFQKGATLAKYPVRVVLDGAMQIEAEALGKGILRVINGTDMVVASSFPKAAADTLWLSLTNELLYTLQKSNEAKAFIFHNEVWDVLKKVQYEEKRFVLDIVTYALDAGFIVKGFAYKRHVPSLSSRLGKMKDKVDSWWFNRKLSLRKKTPFHTSPQNEANMIGAGVRYK
jgi:hypothetical protein